jgi:hypothetical protein
MISYITRICMVWYGMVWYGMVWYGMVWYGMVWYGMVWLKGTVDGNYRVEIYIHLLNLSRNSCETNLRPCDSGCLRSNQLSYRGQRDHEMAWQEIYGDSTTWRM